jgi:hypothetical protein
MYQEMRNIALEELCVGDLVHYATSDGHVCRTHTAIVVSFGPGTIEDVDVSFLDSSRGLKTWKMGWIHGRIVSRWGE